jgi:hypothetical protein
LSAATVDFKGEKWSFSDIQAEQKLTLHSQNDTESKCGVLGTLHLHQSTVDRKTLKVLFKTTQVIVVVGAFARCH